LAQVRSAIATGDRAAALRLLRAYVEGQLDLSNVPAEVGDALVGTARGLKDAQAATAVPAAARYAAESRYTGRRRRSGAYSAANPDRQRRRPVARSGHVR
jgi:hypothetical protein